VSDRTRIRRTPRARSWRERRARAGYALSGLMVLFLLLELVPRAGLVPRRYLPPASRVVGALWTEASGAAFWRAVADTARTGAVGLAVAFAAGVALGLVIGGTPPLRAATASTIELLRPIPSVALIPLVVLKFGTGVRPTEALVVYACFWQVLIQVLHGVTDVDPIAYDTARSYGLGPWARVRHLVLPTALPYIMTGLRLAAAVALILAITGELIIGSPGIGREIAVAQSSGAVATLYGLVLATGLIGVLVNVAVRALERRVLSWHPSVRAEVPA
jgi:ABC-type nitrate/sulfonate/bicarbonate transport system permease component